MQQWTKTVNIEPWLAIKTHKSTEHKAVAYYENIFHYIVIIIFLACLRFLSYSLGTRVTWWASVVCLCRRALVLLRRGAVRSWRPLLRRLITSTRSSSK